MPSFLLVVTPDSVFGMLASAQALTVTMFGGVGTIWGPIIGATILIPTGEILQAQLGARFPGIEGVIYGFAIVVVILVAPEGIYWKVRDVWRRRMASRDAVPVATGAAHDIGIAPATSTTSRVTPQEPGKVILAVRNLSKSFGGLKAVQNVSFDLAQGSILGIIGPNGAGKTTLFNLLNGFQRPDSGGEVLLDGKNVIGLKPHRLCDAGVGRTFQIMRPFPRLSVADNVIIGAYVHSKNDDEARRLATDAIARVGLHDIGDRIAGGLTTKQLRLMELARALAGQPRILLLDETLAGLGSTEAAEVVAVLQTLAKKGITIVIIEHTMHTMVRLVDRFLVARSRRGSRRRYARSGHQGMHGLSKPISAKNGSRMLDIDGISVGYSAIPVLDRVSIHVAEGEFVAVVGPNGAGKTTLFKTISGLLKPTSGTIRFEGGDLLDAAPSRRAHLGIAHVPEGRHVFPSLTVMENLELGAYTETGRINWKSNLEQIFELFPVLFERTRQYAGTLSGGEQQMLAIGRGLASSPKLLMLDEPSMGLAPAVADFIFERLIDIRRQSKLTILLVEQRVAEALESADHGYVLEAGRVVLEGTNETLRANDRVRAAYLGM